MNKTLISTMMLSLLLASSIFAAADAQDILLLYTEAAKANQVLSHQYTFTDKVTHIFFDSHGPRKDSKSETYDVIFVEGERYSKLIAREDQPLSAAEASKE